MLGLNEKIKELARQGKSINVAVAGLGQIFDIGVDDGATIDGDGILGEGGGMKFLVVCFC